MLGAVHRDYRGTGIEIVMALSLLESARKAEFEDISTHLILEDNHRMRAEFERLNIPVQNRFRVYRKEL